MHRATHCWINIPLPKHQQQEEQEYEHFHRSLCLEYPPQLLSGTFKSTNPSCLSKDAAVTGPQSLFVVLPGNPGCKQFYAAFAAEILSSVPRSAVIVPSTAGFSLITEDKHHSHSHSHHHHSKHHQNQNQNQNQQHFHHVGHLHEQHLQQQQQQTSFSSSAASATTSSSSSNQIYTLKNDDDNAKFQNLKETPKGKIFLLQDQNQFLFSFIEHYIIPIQQKFNIDSKNSFLCGHSIGSWFSLHVMDRFPNVFHRACLLAPTIANMAESENGVAMRTLIHVGQHLLPTFVGTILKYVVPDRAINMLVQMTMSHELHAVDYATVRQLLKSRETTKQLLAMASDELSTVNPLPVDLLKRLEEKLSFYFVDKDGWVPNHLRDEIKNKFPNLANFEIEQDQSVTHAWCGLKFATVASFVVKCFKQHSQAFNNDNNNNDDDDDDRDDNDDDGEKKKKNKNKQEKKKESGARRQRED